MQSRSTSNEQQENSLHRSTVWQALDPPKFGVSAARLITTESCSLCEVPRDIKKVTGKDLTKEAPRSPRIRVGGYAILGRTIDKCRALVAGNIGEYHFDCRLDITLFGFKGIIGEDFKAQIEQGASDEELIKWLNRSGEKKTPAQINRWSEKAEASSLYNDLEKRDFFVEETKKLGLDPAKTTTFEWLEIDDRVSHAQQAA